MEAPKGRLYLVDWFRWLWLFRRILFLGFYVRFLPLGIVMGRKGFLDLLSMYIRFTESTRIQVHFSGHHPLKPFPFLYPLSLA